MTLPLGFIGTGSLGGEMARRLLDAGYPLTVCDPNPATVAPLRDRGAKVVATAFGMPIRRDVPPLCPRPRSAVCRSGPCVSSRERSIKNH